MYWRVLDAASFGVPQHRERVIFFGTRRDRPFAFPDPTYGPELSPFLTVGESILDLVDAAEDMPNHSPLKHSERVIARYKLVPEGGMLPPAHELPKEIRRENFGNTYKRLKRSEPALTMVPGNNAFPVHPTLHRSLTPREAARLQSFPDAHVFAGNRSQQCKLVGNAVPPLLAEQLGRSIVRHLSGEVSRAEASAPVALGRATKGQSNRASILSEKLLQEPPASGFVDLFSGAGGLTLGFGRAGWRPLLCVDNWEVAGRTHVHNFDAFPFHLGDLGKSEVIDEIVRKVGGAEVGILAGGPPCQGFSIFGHRHMTNTAGYDPHSDPRNRLVFAFLEVARRLKPRWIVIENVPGFASLDSGYFLESVIAELRSLGFTQTEARILNAADHGVPQQRKRLVIVANRTGHVIPWPKRKFFAEPETWQQPFRTVGEVITDLSTPESLERLTCHVPMNHKELLVERYKHIPEGGSLNVKGLPEHLRRGYRTEEVKNYSHVFKRLHRDKPAGTMVPGHNAFPIHPWLDRALTVREAARIQTFPDEMEFLGAREDQCIQVGNAFPPLLAELIANNIRKAEDNDWRPGSVPRSAYYALVEDPTDEQLALFQPVVAK